MLPPPPPIVALSCSGDFPTLTADDYYTHLMDVLEEVRTKIPKVFVNLVSLGNISEVPRPCPLLPITPTVVSLTPPLTILTIMSLNLSASLCYLRISHYTPQIYKLSLQSPHCVEVHRIIPIECICAFLPGAEGDKLRCVEAVCVCIVCVCVQIEVFVVLVLECW